MEQLQLLFSADQGPWIIYYLQWAWVVIAALVLALPLFALVSVFTGDLSFRARLGWLFILATSGPLGALGYTQTIEKKSALKFFGSFLFFLLFAAAGFSLFLAHGWRQRTLDLMAGVPAGKVIVDSAVSETQKQVFLKATGDLRQRLDGMSLTGFDDLKMLRDTALLGLQTLPDDKVDQLEVSRWQALAAEPPRTVLDHLAQISTEPFPAEPSEAASVAAPALKPIQPKGAVEAPVVADGSAAPAAAGATAGVPIAPTTATAHPHAAAPIPTAGNPTPPATAPHTSVPGQPSAQAGALLVSADIVPASFQSCDAGKALQFGDIACWGWQPKASCGIKDVRACKAKAYSRPPNGECTVPAKRCPSGFAGAVAKQAMGKNDRCLETIWEYACL